LASSPAQEYGLRPGDLIVSYDGVPIRSPRDVRDATVNGAFGELVTMRLLRDGQPVEVALPRGPIGIRMDSVSVAPN
jgi:serine protease Do